MVWPHCIKECNVSGHSKKKELKNGHGKIKKVAMQILDLLDENWPGEAMRLYAKYVKNLNKSFPFLKQHIKEVIK